MKGWIFGIVLFLSGCGILPKETKTSYTIEDLRQPVVEQASQATKDRSEIEYRNLLAQTALNSNNAIQTLAAVERASKPAVHRPQAPNPVKIGMDQLVSVDWVGPVEPILKSLAKKSHYRVNELGESPVVPILVNVNRENAYLADVIQDISFQIQNHAELTLNPTEKLIEIRYL
jgi:defect-in-organelle-trafficking protein DotD